MTTRWVKRISGVSAAVALAIALPVAAQIDQPATMTAPDYDSGASAGAMSDSHFNTPESDGRPGVKFFTYGVQAFRKGDFQHAIAMYKVAASWAYKPAEYNLAIMYFKGHGIPVDRPRGAAWMVLAAERGKPQYVKARDVMVTLLSKTEFVRTDELWGELKNTFGDEVALRRAKAQWTWTKNQKTGSRVGGAVGELYVGAQDINGSPHDLGKSGKGEMFASGWGWIPGGSIDGSMAYRQFQQSDDPYDPVFLKDRTGNVTVEPLQPVQPGSHSKRKPAAAFPPQHPPHSA